MMVSKEQHSFSIHIANGTLRTNEKLLKNQVLGDISYVLDKIFAELKTKGNDSVTMTITFHKG